jgi:hypothetical protein
VSVEAAANRIVGLADEPCVLLYLTWSHTPAAAPDLTVGPLLLLPQSSMVDLGPALEEQGEHHSASWTCPG